MEKILYSIYDKKSKLFYAPFVAETDEVARRSFSQLVNDNNTIIGNFPGDFNLHRVGVINLTNGLITPSLVELVCEGSILKEG